ncbi:ATP-dependent DNA helicase PIF1-like protein [Tanacetum coccineum]
MARHFGDGEIGEHYDGAVSIDLPEEILLDVVDDPVTYIVDFTYLNILDNINDSSYFQEKVILASTNEVVDNMNEHLLEKFPGEEMVCLSSDNVDKTKRNATMDQSIFSPGFINGSKFSSVPNHMLLLKVGFPIILLKNIDQPNGLCNGKRLQVLQLIRTSISAQIINGTHFGKKVIIPRLRITPSDKRLPLKIVRKQFPLSVSFAMAINKIQGQSFLKVGVHEMGIGC